MHHQWLASGPAMRPGRIVMALKTRHDRMPTARPQDRGHHQGSRLVSTITGFRCSEQAIVGANAFAHESGIHQTACSSMRHYEIMTPDRSG